MWLEKSCQIISKSLGFLGHKMNTIDDSTGPEHRLLITISVLCSPVFWRYIIIYFFFNPAISFLMAYKSYINIFLFWTSTYFQLTSLQKLCLLCATVFVLLFSKTKLFFVYLWIYFILNSFLSDLELYVFNSNHQRSNIEMVHNIPRGITVKQERNSLLIKRQINDSIWNHVHKI